MRGGGQKGEGLEMMHVLVCICYICFIYNILYIYIYMFIYMYILYV
jgi:hypothetical protein